MHDVIVDTIETYQSPHRESNPDLTLRRGLFYPLYYKAWSRRTGVISLTGLATSYFNHTSDLQVETTGIEPVSSVYPVNQF